MWFGCDFHRQFSSFCPESARYTNHPDFTYSIIWHPARGFCIFRTGQQAAEITNRRHDVVHHVRCLCSVCWCWRRFDDIINVFVVVVFLSAVGFLVRPFVVDCWECCGDFLLWWILLLLTIRTVKLVCKRRSSKRSWSRRKHRRRTEWPRCIAAGCSPGVWENAMNGFWWGWSWKVS